MKTKKIIYWVCTSLISLMMLFSASQYVMNPEVVNGFKHLGYPDYFRIELAIAKLIGALVLIVPKIPFKLKEFAYAGFGIVFISASVSHYFSGDPMANVITPLVFLGILVVSNIMLKTQNPNT